MDLSRNQLLEMYRQMRTIRSFEDRLHLEISEGNVPGFSHLYAGEEASAVGVCAHLALTDYIGSTHRGHGHCIAKGCDVKGMMKEIFAKRDGLCGGKGGSMHIADFDKGMMGANAIVGGSAPSAVGAALTAKTLKTGAVAVAFMGEGGTNEGAALESLNLASVWQLPVVFVVEDNGYTESTSSKWAVAGDQLERAKGFNIPGWRVAEGDDLLQVYETAGEAIGHARDGSGPALLHLLVPRFYSHYEGDPGTYRPRNEVKELRQNKDCLKTFRARAEKEALVDLTELDRIDGDAEALIEAAVEEAKAAPAPTAGDLLTNVYTTY
jgi:pyruvate dehydrogenase E1 component alpha subunit